MATIVRIKRIALSRLNNAEFITFCRRIWDAVDIVPGIIPTEVDTAFGNDLKLMIDIEQQSRTSDLTAELLVADKRCDEALRYVFNLLAAGRTSPVEADRKAYQTLYNLTKPYRGIQRLPYPQQYAQTRGLLTDLFKDQNAAVGLKIGLMPAVSEIQSANDQLYALFTERAAEQAASHLGPMLPVRERQTARYEVIADTLFAESVARPTEKTAAAIDTFNKIIDEVRHAYNQRIAQLHIVRQPDPEQPPTGGQEDGTEEMLILCGEGTA